MFVLSHPSRLRAVITAMAVLIAGLAFVGVATPARAAGDSTWTGASSTLWSDPANWSGGLPPADADVVFPAGASRKTVVNDVPGGTSVGSVVVSGAGYKISGNALTVTAGVSSSYASGTSVIDLDVLGSGSLTVGGGGVLEVNGALSGPVVLAGGTLSGTGTLNGAGITTSSASTVDPGAAGGPGVLKYASSTALALPATSTFHVDLDGPTVGTGYDQLKLTSGSALLNPNGASLSVGLGYLPAVNTSFQIVSQTTSSPITGRFNGISQFGTYVSGPVTFSVGYFNSGIILTVTEVNVATFTWDGGGTTSNWSDAVNWSGDVAPSFAAALVFPAGVAKLAPVNDLASELHVSALTIAAPGYEVSGNSVGLVGGLIATYGSGASTISLPLVIGAIQTVYVSAGGRLELASQTTGAGGLTKTSAGTLHITGTASYTGPTVVSAGRLAIDTSLASSSSVQVAAGTTISGDGTLPAVSVSGRLLPGTLATGALTLANNAELSVEITEGTASQVDVTGAVTVTGSTLVTSLAFVPALGSTFPLVRNDGVDAITGTFVGLAEGATYVVNGVTLKVSYLGGDGNDVVLTVVTVPTVTTLSSSVMAAVSGEPVTFAATATTKAGAPVPGGTIRFLIEGEQVQAPAAVDEDGQVTFTSSALPIGATAVVAEYGGSTGYAVSSHFLVQAVGTAATTTVLDVTSGPVPVGDAVVLTATVEPVAPGGGTSTGSVSFYDGATPLGTAVLNGSGVATFTTRDLGLGSHSLTAVYAGSDGYTTSTSAAVTRTVVKRPTTVVVTAGPSTSYGEAVTFTAAVTDADEAVVSVGTIRFVIGGEQVQAPATVDADGQVTFTTSSLPVGDTTVVAEYAGSTGYADSSDALDHTVGAAATSTILSLPSGPFVVGKSVDLTATVTATAPGAGTPSGSVSFYDGATLLGAATLNGSGVATFTVSDLAVGSYSLTAAYAGSADYTSSTSAAVTRTVAKRPTTVDVTSGSPTAYGKPVTFTATVTDAGLAVAGGSVRFLVGGDEVQAATPVDGAGRATYTTSTLPVGEATVTAEYVGTATLADATGSATHLVTSVATVRVNPTITAHVTSSKPKSKAGWYRKEVRITFTCTPGSAALAGPCPAAVTLGRSGKDRVLRRGITARDGGSATARVVLSIDRKAPTLKVKRQGNKLRCQATDARSGVAICTITKKTRAGVVRWVAKATDRAGNVTKRKGRFHKR